MATRRRRSTRTVSKPVNHTEPPCWFCGGKCPGTTWRAKVRNPDGTWLVGAQYIVCSPSCPDLPEGERNKLHQYVNLNELKDLPPAKQRELVESLHLPGV